MKDYMPQSSINNNVDYSNSLAPKKIRALVVGATGLVGASLVKQLLASDSYGQVTVISRREIPREPKLKLEIWPNFNNKIRSGDSSIRNVFKEQDVVFCCLGASKWNMLGLLVSPKKYSKEFFNVDYEMCTFIADKAARAGVKHFSVISSPDANCDSKFLYLKYKGMMERDIMKDTGFQRTSFFRPGTLLKQVDTGPLCQLRNKLIKWFSLLIPYGLTLAPNLARAMLNDARDQFFTDTSKASIWEKNDIDNMR